MDYRYEVHDKAKDFHEQRIAFIILNGVLEFLPKGQNISHYEYCQMKGISKEKFNKLTRGYYLNGNVDFYKDNFIYDAEVIENALKVLEEISKAINVNEFDIYFGELPDQGFKLDYHYGRYVNGVVEKY